LLGGKPDGGADRASAKEKTKKAGSRGGRHFSEQEPRGGQGKTRKWDPKPERGRSNYYFSVCVRYYSRTTWSGLKGRRPSWRRKEDSKEGRVGIWMFPSSAGRSPSKTIKKTVKKKTARRAPH